LADAFAVTPVVPDALLIAAAIAIALAAFVEDVAVVSEAVSSNEEAATIEVPLILKVPAFNKPVVAVEGAVVVAATLLSIEVMLETFALYVPAVSPALASVPLLVVETVIDEFVVLDN